MGLCISPCLEPIITQFVFVDTRRKWGDSCDCTVFDLRSFQLDLPSRLPPGIGCRDRALEESLRESLPLPPLAPVLGSEVQTLGVDAQVSLVHRSLVSLHDVLGESQDVLTLEERRHRTGRRFALQLN